MTEPAAFDSNSLFDADNQMGRDPLFVGGAYGGLDDVPGYSPLGRMTRQEIIELNEASGPGRAFVGGARRTRRRNRKSQRKSKKVKKSRRRLRRSRGSRRVY